ncbi:MAG: CocE/NonD family hydrolase [Geminicoccaceae bacterium]
MMVGPAQGGPSRADQEVARIVDPGELPHAIREVHHAWIPLADGVRLACRYWLPVTADREPVPAILEYIPYCKRDGTAARDEAMHPYFAGHGYAAIRVDMRGSGESEGVLLDEYLRQEQDDALEVIAWIAAQPWCTGKVGMMGKSWGGFNGLQVAARRPPALKAVISMYSTDDRYADDIHTMGGCQLAEHPNWSFVMFPLNARPPDPLLVGPGWEAMWRQRLEAVRPWIIGWLHHQRRDEFWKHGSVCEDYGAIQCPVYLIGGWADGYSNPVPRLMAGLACPKKALIGPWGHQYQHQASPGPMMGYMSEALRWWDHWLKDVDTGIMAEPAYRVWMNDSERPQTYYAQRSGRWVAESSWPSGRIAEAAFHPDGAGRLGETPSAARLTAAVPASYGACTPFWSNMGGVEPESPRDQRADDALGLTFTGPALEAPLEILGQPRLELELEVDQPTAFVSARLCDVQPDGASTLVTYGVLNLTHDATHETVTPLTPGRRYRVSVALNDIAHRFLAGNRVRLSLGTGLWPVIWPAPRPVGLTLHTEGCRLVLPTRASRPEDATLRALPPAEHTAVQPVTALRPAQPTVARIEEDLVSGMVSFVHEEDGGQTRIDRDGWCFGARFERRFSVHPDDPSTARIELRAVKEFGREGSVQARIEAWQLMTATLREFRLQASIAVSDGGRPMLHRVWDESIPRDGC